ncbi:MAG: alpha-amylase family glycosyl hydrolase [Acidobacteriota bacterium]|nr:alpha-amylase family glycosyl hydrolase [Acidobacteriota bacterium]
MNNKNSIAAARISSSFLVFILLLSFTSVAQPGGAPKISKVEPPNWWAGYVPVVMVLLYGENLAGADVSVDYAGASVAKVQTERDGKHAFVWLNFDPTAEPGDVPIRLKTASGETRVTLPLLKRASEEGKFQGITPNDVIYLIMPDRFADGDPSNNQPKDAAPGTYDRSRPKTYHGGDLRGVSEHLPYLKDLGVTALWITPLYDNDNSTSDYHGYGAVDEYSVEDHFGTMRDFQQLVAAAHQLGLKVLLDMVPNHVGPKHPWATSQPSPNWLHGTTEHHLDTDYFYPPITDPHAVKANYVSALEGWFANALPDLAQENPLVAQYLLENAYWWTESSGLDGFRIDTFPYVPRAFWAYYHQGLFSTYPHFFTVGEIYDFNPTVTSYWAGGQTGFDGIDTRLTTPFDFPMNSAIREVVAHGVSAKRIVEVLRQDRLYPHPELLVTFIGNHDMKRFLTDANGSREKLKLAFSLLATLRGIPQLYYGDEIGMGGGDDPDNRQDFPGGFPGDQHDAFTRAGRTPDEQDVYSHVQTLMKLRAEHPALRIGVQKHVAVADKYYAFTRETESERLLIVFHNGDAPESVTLDLANTSIADAKSLTPIFGGSAAQLNGGQVQTQLPPNSLVIFREQ